MKRYPKGYHSAARRRLHKNPVSRREREVWALVAEGLTSKQIARRLRITADTIDVHRYNLHKKLKVHTATAMVALWYTKRRGKR